MDTDSTRSRAEGDGRSAANQCCDMKADLATIGPEATLKAQLVCRTDARKVGYDEGTARPDKLR